MKRTLKPELKLAWIALALAGMLGAMVPARSGPLTIANEPLGSPPGLILPNVMFLLDDSGSMANDFMPDYVNDSQSLPSSASSLNYSTAGCADSGDETALAAPGPAQSLGDINGPPKACGIGDPPYNSPDFNGIYYNPGIFYLPGVDAPDAVTGVQTDKLSQNAANTANWTAVTNNPYTGAATINLAASYPDRVWCTAKSDVATSGNCRQNTAYQYPDAVFAYGRTASGGLGAIKTIGVSPYFYRMQTAQYCQFPDLTNCKTGSQINPAVHIYQAPEFCNDAELTDCKAGKALADAQTAVPGSYVFSGPRWCSDPGTLASCRKKKIAVPITPATSPATYTFFIHGHHLGTTLSQNCVSAATPGCGAVSNQGNINVSAVVAGGGTITNITINGVRVIAGTITVPAGSTTTAAAGLIARAIGIAPGQVGGFVSAPDYTATASGNNVRVSRVTAGASGAGDTITVTANAVGTVPAIGRVTVNTGPATSQTISTVKVNGVNMLCPVLADIVFGTATVKAPTGSILSIAGTSTSTQRTNIRNALASRINACTATNGGYTANISSSDVRITAPTSLGSTANGYLVTVTGIGSLANFVPGTMGISPMQAGVSVANVTTTASVMSGGQDAFVGARTVRIGVGLFSRTDIVPSVNSYPKTASRSDCSGATCTYPEEMTNFANWYAYYRTRMQMVKTATGRAFIPIDTNYRVGFITICPIAGSCGPSASTAGQNVVSSKYLKIDDFTAAHKNAWYNILYSTTPLGFTPLREALSRVGTIYAGKFGTGLTAGLTAAADDPVTRSCQPNFTLLTTDGYWNGAQGLREDGATAIGNVDNANTGPYSLQSQGVFDGGTPVASNTLADVALYYYQTDLRPVGPVSQNNVPTTNKDTASHQHMVTFTVGLGMDGELTYPGFGYESSIKGDFFDVKQGVKKWPVPVADQQTALDDLWHAAVNGRGVFYSIKNPADLAGALTDMRNQLEARLGAGAAAATSNLQPVAGDNFAFTASFTTETWTGDLKARTIDLSSGIVSTVALWSAATLLDSTPFANRRIYTFDATDTVASGVENGNRLKSFCPPGDGGANCMDSTGLTSGVGGEMSLFAAGQLPQSFSPAQQAVATNASLVNYLRGDRSFENSSPSRTLATDLYRARASVMGDIVNAQPAYVKRTPFSYNAPADTGFLAFRACTEGNGTGCPAAQFPTPFLPRLGTVYAAGNDGMLHAFETDKTNNPFFQTGGISTPTLSDDTFTGDNTGNGVERWAYVPALVMPKLYKLASEPYSHTYLTDGTPQVGDICVSTPCAGIADWRTILVGGLNSGGIGYYALDITNPLTPKGLWELTFGPCLTVDGNGVPIGRADGSSLPPAPRTSDCHLGLSYGNAIMTKRFFDQRWVVIVTSGYNNTAGAGVNQGSGKGYIYILDAVTGNILHRLTTGVGTLAVNPLAVPPQTGPSGLAKINGWTTNGVVDNTVLAIYGGDLEGNLWRFKLDFPVGGSPSVTKIAVLKDPAGATQSVTVKPELADVNGERVIVLGTGKFLELNDKLPPQTVGPPPVTLPFPTQTIYALRDIDLSNVGAGPLFTPEVRSNTGVKALQFTGIAGTDNRTLSVVGGGTLPNLATDLGWRIDLPENGERVNVDPVLQLGTLVIGSNVPTTDTCSAGGFSFVNFIDVTSGSFVISSPNSLASTKIASSVLVGLNVIMLPGGAIKTIATLADETRRSEDTPVPPAAFVGKRVSWREMFTY